MNAPRAVRNRRGITLIELIIAIGIGVAVIASAYGLLNYGFRVYGENAARIQAQQNVRTVALYLSRDLHRADPDSMTVSVVPQANGWNKLTVGSATYWLNDEDQVEKGIAGDPSSGYPMVSDISALTITPSGGPFQSGDTIAYTITGVYTDKNRQQQTITVSSSVTLR